MVAIQENSTISQAKEYVEKNLKRGVNCPCCLQFAKTHERQIHSSMARQLIRLHNMGPFFHHYKQITQNTDGGYSDFSKLRFWRLVEREFNVEPAKRNSGMWRITDRGSRFVRREIALPKVIEIYDNKPRRIVGDETVTIEQCLGKKFNYLELMNNL